MDPLPPDAAAADLFSGSDLSAILESLNSAPLTLLDNDPFLGLSDTDLPPFDMDLVHEVTLVNDVIVKETITMTRVEHLMNQTDDQQLLVPHDNDTGIPALEAASTPHSNTSSPFSQTETVSDRLHMYDESGDAARDQFADMVSEERSALPSPAPTAVTTATSTSHVSGQQGPGAASGQKRVLSEDVPSADPLSRQSSNSCGSSGSNEQRFLRPAHKLQKLVQQDSVSRCRNLLTMGVADPLPSRESEQYWPRSDGMIPSPSSASAAQPFQFVPPPQQLPPPQTFRNNNNGLSAGDRAQSFSTHTLVGGDIAFGNPDPPQFQMYSQSMLSNSMPEVLPPGGQQYSGFKRPNPSPFHVQMQRNGLPPANWTPRMAESAPQPDRRSFGPPAAGPFCRCPECTQNFSSVPQSAGFYYQSQEMPSLPPQHSQSLPSFQQMGYTGYPVMDRYPPPVPYNQQQLYQMQHPHTTASNPQSMHCSPNVTFVNGLLSAKAEHDEDPEPDITAEQMQLRHARVAMWLDELQMPGHSDSASFFSDRSTVKHFSRPPTPPIWIGKDCVYELICPNGCDGVKLPCTNSEMKHHVKQEPLCEDHAPRAPVADPLSSAASGMTSISVGVESGGAGPPQAFRNITGRCQPHFGRHIPIPTIPMDAIAATCRRVPASPGKDPHSYARPRPFDLELLQIGNFRVDNQNQECKRFITKVKIVPAKRWIIYEFPIPAESSQQSVENEEQQARSFALMVPFKTITAWNADKDSRNVFLTINQCPLLFSSEGSIRNTVGFDKTSSVDPSGGEIYLNRLHRIQLKGATQVDRFVNALIDYYPAATHMKDVTLNPNPCFHRSDQPLPEADDV